MTINQKTNSTQRVPVNTINTIIEQISDLQEDLGDVKQEVNGLSTSVDTINLNVTGNATIADLIVNSDLEVNHATINNLGGTNVDVAKVTASNIEGNKLVGNLIETTVLDVAETGYFGEIEVSSDTKLTDVEARDITANKIKANQTEASEAKVTNALVAKEAVVENGLTVTGLTDLEDVKADSLKVDGNVEVGNLDVIGGLSITGTFNTDNINATNVMAGTLYTDETIIAGNNHLVPTPNLDNNDTYTIELPVFTGTLLLVWKEGDATIWSAVVSGEGTDYSIKWSNVGSIIKVTDLFQWNKKLYIRTNANGSLYYSSNTTSEINEINIYYNMVGWAEEKSLEELTDLNKTHYVCSLLAGTFSFGSVLAPSLTTLGQATLDEIDVNKINVNGVLTIQGKELANYHTTIGTINENLIYRATQHTYDYSESAFDGLFYEVTSFMESNQIPEGAKLIYDDNGTLKFCTTYPPYSGLQFGKPESVAANKEWFEAIEWLPETVELADFRYRTPVIHIGDDYEVATQDVLSFVDYRENATDTLLDLRSAEIAATKQDKLVSGTNIKTINGKTMLGSGNIEIDVSFFFPIGIVIEMEDTYNPNNIYPNTIWIEI